jgi:hypothetical protein
MATKAKPPMTPPAMAPAWDVPPDAALLVPVVVGVAVPELAPVVELAPGVLVFEPVVVALVPELVAVTLVPELVAVAPVVATVGGTMYVVPMLASTGADTFSVVGSLQVIFPSVVDPQQNQVCEEASKVMSSTERSLQPVLQWESASEGSVQPPT